jgi:2-oxoglutarate dehydrogenase complex dehydrogenase (E1) component-like enzyme
MRVTMPSTAAQYFHLLRSQMHAGVLKPLIVMTPKSLLRAHSARSAARGFIDGGFQVLLDDPLPASNVRRILMCSGKVSFDLMEFREQNKISDTAIIRVEQLYPFPFEGLKEIFDRYPNVHDLRWVQEEPRNMGAWSFVRARLRYIVADHHRISYIGRVPSGSPATGSQRIHQLEQEHIVRQAFAAL